MSYPHMYTTSGLGALAAEIDAERARQIAKFGDQRHPDGTRTDPTARLLSNAACILTEYHATNGTLTWRHILDEEVQEAFAETAPDALRAELVQVMAVCAAWISDLDRRTAEGCDRA